MGYIPIELVLDESPADRFYVLEIAIYTVEGYSVGNYSIPIVSEEGLFMTQLFKIADGELIEMDTVEILQQLSGCFQTYPLMRVGRKFSMSEELRAKGKAIEKYLMEPIECKKSVVDKRYIQEVDYMNPAISAIGRVSCGSLPSGGIKFNYSLAPQTKGKLLLEGGLAFLLDTKIKHLQWLGFGPYAS